MEGRSGSELEPARPSCIRTPLWRILAAAMALDVGIDSALAGRVQLGILVFDAVVVREADAVLQAEVDALGADLRREYGGGRSAEVPGAEEARRLYKAVGIDPTKTRPSSEALLRRALKGEPLYRINTLVDVINLCSLRHQLPYGLYDRARLVPPVTLRMGREGEGYEGIRKGTVNVSSRPVLVDQMGPFGNPTSDSLRTCITLEAKDVFVVVYAPHGFSPAPLARVLDSTADTVIRHCGGRLVERFVLPRA
jgi:DNA/RNA-binding domain of Phe-tRNA-synthetase-like protein